MFYVRVGTRLLFFRTENPEAMCHQLITRLFYRKVTLEEGLRDSDENSSLLFIIPMNREIMDPDGAEYILLAEGSGTAVFTGIINAGLVNHIRQVEMGPRILILRVPENEEEVLSALAKDYDAQKVTWQEGVLRGSPNQTLLWLTTQRLHPSLADQAVYPYQLLIDQPFHECYARLRREALLYITHSLKDGSWYEYRINIYDSKDQYELHYQRLIQVVSVLELGMVLGESWTRDHALVLMSVLAYQVRMFSFMTPVEVKRILMGLEYDETGRRLVDMDLYHRNKKIPWTETQGQSGRLKDKRSKKEEGMHCRKKLMEMLPGRDRERLLHMEAVLISNLK